MFNFLYCCPTNDNHEVTENEYEKEENKKLLKIFSNSSKYLKTQPEHSETQNKSSTILDEEDSHSTKIILKEPWLIREGENNLQFSKKGLIELYDRLDNLSGVEKFYDKNNLTLYYNKNGSEFSKNSYLGKSVYKMEKKELYKNKDGTFMELNQNDKISYEDIKNFVYIKHFN